MNAEEFDQFIADNAKANPAEATLLRKLWTACKKAGNPIVSVWDGEEDTKVSTRKEMFRVAFNLDQCHLYTESGAYVFFVMGNEWDAISDYNVSLEDTIAPVNDYAMSKW